MFTDDRLESVQISDPFDYISDAWFDHMVMAVLIELKRYEAVRSFLNGSWAARTARNRNTLLVPFGRYLDSIRRAIAIKVQSNIALVNKIYKLTINIYI